MRALSLPGCACRGAFQFAVVAKLIEAGERFDLVAGASSGSICAATTVAGLAQRGPDFARSLADNPIFSPRYLRREKSPFGMGQILRETLRRNLPEELLHDTEAELLVATTHAKRYAVGFGPVRAGEPHAESLVVHSNRTRKEMHEVILASCFIPVLYAGVTRIDGEIHLDGAIADNTLLDALAARGATEITVVTPFPRGAVARTMFSPEAPLAARPGVRLRVIHPREPLAIGRFDLSRERLEQALTAPFEEQVIDPPSPPTAPPGPVSRGVSGRAEARPDRERTG